MLVIGLAQYLHDMGIGTFDPTGTGGDIYIARQPPDPDICMALFPSGGYQADGKIGIDYPTVKIIVRSTTDPRPGFEKAQSILGVLHGAHRFVLPDGTQVINCRAVQSAPAHIGTDANTRHEFSLNFELAVVAPDTANRE